MKTIKEILERMQELADEMLDLTNELSEQMTEPNEFVAVKDIEIAIHEARKVFERTKNINGE